MVDQVAIGHVGRKFSVIIPKALRAGIARGDTVLISRQGDHIVLRSVSKLGNILRTKVKPLPSRVSTSQLSKVQAARKVSVPLPKRDKHGHFLPSKKGKG